VRVKNFFNKNVFDNHIYLCMMVTMKTKVAKFIKLARASVGITQQEFSKMIGVQRCSLAKYETAAVMPPAIVILNVIALCGISTEQLKVISEGR